MKSLQDKKGEVDINHKYGTCGLLLPFFELPPLLPPPPLLLRLGLPTPRNSTAAAAKCRATSMRSGWRLGAAVVRAQH
jgi:hypothetical protein